MADNTELFEYIFAVRISLQDEFENEADIIRELKMTLREMGMGSNESNQILHNFYQTYGIDISIDKIKEASDISNQLMNNMLGFMLSPGDFGHSGHPDDNDDDNLVEQANNDDDDFDNENEDNYDNDDNDDNEHNHHHIQNIEQILQQAFVQALGLPGLPVQTQFGSNNQNQLESETEEINEETTQNIPSIPSIPSINQGNFSFSYNGNTWTVNSQNLNSPMTHISGPSIGTHSSMINVLNTLMGSNGLNNMPFAQSMFTDVVVSTDNKDLESLKTSKLETKLDTDCSICMGHLEKDEEVSELKCSHIFHTECIKPYLEQYNYKCPVCRAEVGKAKYHM